MPRTDNPLTLERILAAAMALADASGVASLTMRALATELEVTPMSIYRYIDNKEALLDGMVDAVFGEISAPTVGNEWRQEMVEHAHSARRVLLAHPWALSLMETRINPGPATLAHHDAMIGTLRSGGFSISLTAHAFAVLDAYVYGFVLQEVSLPFDPQDTANETVQAMTEDLVDMGGFPHLIELATQHFASPNYRFGDQFDFGLSLVIDGLTPLASEAAEHSI